MMSRRGLSLVETLLAIGLFAFAGIGLIGLFGVGLGTASDAIGDYQSRWIFEQIAERAQIDETWPVNSAAAVWFDSDGNALAGSNGAVYVADLSRVTLDGQPWDRQRDLFRVHLRRSGSTNILRSSIVSRLRTQPADAQ